MGGMYNLAVIEHDIKLAHIFEAFVQGFHKNCRNEN